MAQNKHIKNLFLNEVKEAIKKLNYIIILKID